MVEIDTPSIAVTNLTINKATGEISGVVDGDGTIHDPTLVNHRRLGVVVPRQLGFYRDGFPDNWWRTGWASREPSIAAPSPSASRSKGFTMAVGTIFTADASGVIITYDPSSKVIPHQQLVEIGSGTGGFQFHWD